MISKKCPACKGTGEVEAPKLVPCKCDCGHRGCRPCGPNDVLCEFCYYGNAFDDYPHDRKGRKERAARAKSQTTGKVT